MEPDFSLLDAYLAENDLDGYVFHADSTNSDQYYLSGFDAPDPFLSLYTPERTALLVRHLEYGRAKKESRADDVQLLADYGYRELYEEFGATEATFRGFARFLDAYGVETVGAPSRFPLAVADGLRELGRAVHVDNDDVVTDVRAVKQPEEVEYIRAAQRSNQAAMARAESMLRDATVEDGVLMLDGEVLTSERVRSAIEFTLLEHGCTLDETIVAGGAQGAEPHNRGSGPLPAGEPIVVDIFPRDKSTKYFGDMTRTFVKGEPTPEAREWYELTQRAFEAGLDAVEPGATGEHVHDVVCDVFEAAGAPTLRADENTETGFIHSTGHGVGLDVHEGPRVSRGGEKLEPGHVITIEPGLYDPEIGGVRIEDLVVVTEDGYENLTDYPVSFVVN